MKNLRTGYAYLFYFFYNSVNKVKDNIFVQWKAMFIILILECFILLSIFIEYGNIDKTVSIPENFNRLNLLIPILPLVFLKLWFFERNENWKRYIEEFNAWPIEKQKRWNLVMRIIVIFVFANLIFSFYWMSQIDWSKYR